MIDGNIAMSTAFTEETEEQNTQGYESKYRAMTPKDKAEELVIKMYGHTIGKEQAKRCAIVAVGELICSRYDNKDYWLQVKKEIEQL